MVVSEIGVLSRFVGPKWRVRSTCVRRRGRTIAAAARPQRSGREEHPAKADDAREDQECFGVSGALVILRAEAKAVVSTAVWMIPETLSSVSRIGWYVTSNEPV